MLLKTRNQMNINKILTQCKKQHQSPVYLRYLSEKDLEIDDFRKNIDSSIHILKNAEDSQVEDLQQTKITGFSYHNKQKDKLSKMKIKDFSPPIKKLKKIKTHRRLASSISEIHPDKNYISLRTDSSDQMNIPQIIYRIKRNKLPQNASRNSLIHPSETDRGKERQDHTYDNIKSQRMRVDELRRMNVLGKIIGENMKKQIKELEVRKKINQRQKMNHKLKT